MDEHGTDHRKIVLSLPDSVAAQANTSLGKQGLLASLLVVLVFLTFWPVLRGEFFFDDNGYIIGNRVVMAPDGLARIWRGDGMVDYWPLSFSLFWVEWRLFGDAPLGYHVVNLLIHAMTSLVLWRVLMRWGFHHAWWAALLFALHPANSLAASWIFQTRTTLAACLCMLTVLGWSHWSDRRSTRSLVLAFLAFTLSLLAKPIGILLPLFWLWWEFSSKRRLTRQSAFQSLPFFGVALISGGVGLWFQQWKQTASDEFLLAQTLPDRILQIIRASGFYLRQALFPSNLMLIHPQWPNPVDDLANIVVGLVTCVGLVTLLVLAKRGAIWQRIGLATVWFILALIPSLGIFYIPFFVYAPVSEHYLYLAIPGVIVAAIETMTALLGRWPKLSPWIYGSIASIFCVFSNSRAQVYQHEESVWQETITKNPGSWLAYYNLGVRAYQSGQKAEATIAFEKALDRRRNLAEAAYNLGVIAQESQDLPRAQTHLKHAIDQRPDFCSARNLYAVVYYRLKSYDEALHQWREAVLRCPDFAEAHYNLGVLLARRGDYQAARMHLIQATQLSPDFQEPRFNIASGFQKQAEARALLQTLDAIIASPVPGDKPPSPPQRLEPRP